MFFMQNQRIMQRYYFTNQILFLSKLILYVCASVYVCMYACMYDSPSAMSHSLTLAQLRTEKLAKKWVWYQFYCEYSHLKSWDKDSQLKQMPCPLFSKLFVECNCMSASKCDVICLEEKCGWPHAFAFMIHLILR